MPKDTEFNRKKAVIRLVQVVDNIDHISISDFKEILGSICTECDLRDTEDRTDFSFLKRRKSDK